MNDLDTLALKYNADKWGKHHYTPVYYDLFKDRRESVKKVVELGIGEGASLRMWNEFFLNAIIYGADIDPDRYVAEPGDPRIQIIKCDQTSDDSLIDLTNLTDSDVDLFIDDGSHKPEDQIFTALTLLPLLKEDAIYVIEDVADVSIDKPIRIFAHNLNRLVELKRLGKRRDDQLIIIKPI